MTVAKQFLRPFIPAFAVYRVSSIFRYGADASIRLEFAEGTLLAECGTPSLVPVDDPSEAVAAALDEPIDYPSSSAPPRPVIGSSLPWTKLFPRPRRSSPQ